MDGDIEGGDFGHGGLGRDDVHFSRETNFNYVSVEVTVKEVFLTFGRYERMSSLKEIRVILVYFYMMVSYQMRNSFSCTMKSS